MKGIFLTIILVIVALYLYSKYGHMIPGAGSGFGFSNPNR